VRVDVFQASIGRRVLAGRLVARFAGRTRSFDWDGRRDRRGARVRDGHFVVRVQARDAAGRRDVRRIAMRRTGGRWHRRPAFARRDACRVLGAAGLARSVFGGTDRRPLKLTYAVRQAADVRVEVLRGARVVKRLPAVSSPAGATVKTRIRRRLNRIGDYRVRIVAQSAGTREVAVLVGRRL